MTIGSRHRAELKISGHNLYEFNCAVKNVSNLCRFEISAWRRHHAPSAREGPSFAHGMQNGRMLYIAIISAANAGVTNRRFQIRKRVGEPPLHGQ
jgi:hypothetical protein